VILLTAEAISDIERLREFLQPKNPDAAARALRAIWSALERVESFPNLGRPTGDPRIHQIVVASGARAYIVRYTVLPGNEAILVTRIWHGRELR
jgi:Plasmid stabilisation system protein.